MCRAEVSDVHIVTSHANRIRGLKFTKLGPTRLQNYRHLKVDCRLADKAVQVSKLVDLQKLRSEVHCGEQNLENGVKFQYLGTVFAVNGLQCYDIDARVAVTMSRCGNLRHIFDSPHLSLKLKLGIPTSV